MKQSAVLVFIQVLGLAVSFFSTFYVAANIPAELYAVVGVKVVIDGFVVLFSNTGFDTYAIRNVLSWKEKNEEYKIKVIVTESLTLRLLVGFLLLIPAFLYVFYMSNTKFNGDYIILFLSMSLISIIVAAKDSISLLLKSFNRYISASLVSKSVNVFGNFAALFIFIKFGFDAYIWTVVLLPIVVFIIVVILIYEYLDFSTLAYESIKSKLHHTWRLALSSYIMYPYKHLDQFLVSVFLPNDSLGSYTLAKKLLSAGNGFVKNIFDPINQKLVAYKDKPEIFRRRFKRNEKIKYIFLLGYVLLSMLIYVNIEFLLNLLSITHYPNISVYILTILIGVFTFSLYRNQDIIVKLVYHERHYLYINIIISLTALIGLFTFLMHKYEYMFLYVSISNISALLYVNYTLRKNDTYKISTSIK